MRWVAGLALVAFGVWAGAGAAARQRDRQLSNNASNLAPARLSGGGAVGAGGRTGEAQQTLERAEARALDRPVPLFQTGSSDQSPLAEDINRALQALGAGNRGQAVRVIEAALQRQQ